MKDWEFTLTEQCEEAFKRVEYILATVLKHVTVQSLMKRKNIYFESSFLCYLYRHSFS